MSENKQSVSDLISLARSSTQSPESQEKLIDMMEGLNKKLSTPEFSIRGVDFKIKKLNALEGWRILDEMRQVIGETQSSGDNFNMTDFLRLPHDFIDDRLINAFFPSIDYCIKSESGKKIWISVSIGLDDTQLSNKLEAVDIYELLLRSFFVNFTKSVKSILVKIEDILNRL